MDAGSVTNMATASGTDPHSQPVTSNSATVTVPASDAYDGLTLSKSFADGQLLERR